MTCARSVCASRAIKKGWDGMNKWGRRKEGDDRTNSRVRRHETDRCTPYGILPEGDATLRLLADDSVASLDLQLDQIGNLMSPHQPVGKNLKVPQPSDDRKGREGMDPPNCDLQFLVRATAAAACLSLCLSLPLSLQPGRGIQRRVNPPFTAHCRNCCFAVLCLRWAGATRQP